MASASWGPLPARLAAREPPELRGTGRDQVRLLVTTTAGDTDLQFASLERLLAAGDLLVVNASGTLPASLPARARFGEFRLNFSTRYGPTLWLAEPRWEFDRPGPLPLQDGDNFRVGRLTGTVVARFPGTSRLLFVRVDGSVEAEMLRDGRPIRYGYSAGAAPLEAYQTIFAKFPGSAEMPSAGRPFTPRLVSRLTGAGVHFADVVLHAGVSSVERGDWAPGAPPVFPEPFEVPVSTAQAVAATRRRGGRVIAVGTTVLRALESAWEGGAVRACRGFTRLYIRPGRRVNSVAGILTGLHDTDSTHLDLLEAVVGPAALDRSYRHAIRHGYLWHEFGDSQLIFRAGAPAAGRAS